MFEDILKKIAKELDLKSIPYMVIGGQAVLLYGEPRLTKDIDITLGVDIDKIEEVLDSIKNIDLLPLPENTKDFVEKTFVLPVKDTATNVRVDFIFSKTSYESQAIKKSNKIKIKDYFVKFARLEDVIIHKIFAGRPRDMEDVKSILIKNPDFDKSYIKKWLKEFDNLIEGKNFVSIFEKFLKN
jgi:predicted nucleotidyltransferase